MPFDILVESAKRTSDSTSSADFTIQLSNTLGIIDSIELKYLRFDSTVYNINSSNNYVSFTDNLADPATHHCSLTPGYYSGTDLATLLGTAMTTASGVDNTYTVTYNLNTFYFTISGTSAFVMLWATLSGTITSPYLVLGFTNANTDVANSATSFTSTNAAQLDPYQIINISIREFDDMVYTGNQTSVNSTFRIPLKEGLAGLQLYLPYKTEIKPIKPAIFQKLRVKMTDTSGNILGINNTDWEMEIRVWTSTEQSYSNKRKIQ